MDVSTSPKLSRGDQCRKIARLKSDRKRQAAFRAIAQLADATPGHPITQAAVARRAEVSTVFIRSHPAVVQAIDEAEKARTAGLVRVDPDTTARDVLLGSLRRRIDALARELDAKNATIRQKQREIDALYGTLAAKSTLADPDLRRLYQEALARARMLEGDDVPG